MLDLLRNRGLNSVVMGAVIVATVLVFVIQFNPSAGKQAAPLWKKCAATVRGTCIDPKEHTASYLFLVPIDQHGERSFARARSMNLADTVLDALVERELLIDEAERLGLSVSDQEVLDEIIKGHVHVSVPSDNPSLGMSLGIVDGMRFNPYEGKPLAFFRDAKTKEFLDDTKYKNDLNMRFHMSEIEFREWQQRELLAQKMRDLIKAPVRVSDAEAQESYLREKSQAVVTSVEVNPEFGIVFGDAPKDADVDAWAADDKNKKDVDGAIAARKTDPTAPKDGHIRHILVKFPPNAQPSEKHAALEKLTRAVALVKHGETFSEVAKTASADTGSAMQGGDVGDKTDGFVLPFKKAADALKPGEMTAEAIETQFGYHVIMKDDPTKLEREVKREAYVKAHATEWAKGLAATIRTGAQAGKSLDDAVKAALGGLKPVPLLGVVPDPALSARDAGASADASSEAGATSQAGDAGAAVTPPPSNVLVPEADPMAPHTVTSQGFNKGDDPIPTLGSADSLKLLDFAFSAKDGDVMSDVLTGGDSQFVVALKQQKQATPEEYLKDRDTYVQTLLGRKQTEALAAYVKRLRDASKSDVKRDETYMAQYHGDAGADETDEQQ